MLDKAEVYLVPFECVEKLCVGSSSFRLELRARSGWEGSSLLPPSPIRNLEGVTPDHPITRGILVPHHAMDHMQNLRVVAQQRTMPVVPAKPQSRQDHHHKEQRHGLDTTNQTTAQRAMASRPSELSEPLLTPRSSTCALGVTHDT